MELSEVDIIQLEKEIKKKEEAFGLELYHYTSLNTLFKMVKSREIWMCSTGSMNDRKETLYYIELLEKRLAEYNHEDFFKQVYNQIPFNYKYALCLSREKDDAAQWERYGDFATGVCLAINVAELYKCLYGYGDMMFNEVFYNDTVENDLYCRVLEKYFFEGKIDVYGTEEELIKHLIYAGNLHKHKSFKNENEVRVIPHTSYQTRKINESLTELGQELKREDLKGSRWLLLYEIQKGDLLDGKFYTPISQLPAFFSELTNRSISFYLRCPAA